MSNPSSTHFDKAADLYRTGLADEAIHELKQAITLEPGLVKAYVALAGLYEGRKGFEQALLMYRKVLTVDPDNVWANLRLGILLNHLGRNEEALTPLRVAWSNDRKSYQAANCLARVLDETGDTSTAQIMYEEALYLNPDLTDARFNLATLRYNDHNYDSAIALYTTYMLKAGDSSLAYCNIGKSFVQLGQIDAAMNSFKKALALSPEEPAIYFNLGIAFTLKRAYNKSIECFDRALKIDPKYVEARYCMAKALRRNEMVIAAMEQFQQILTQHPEHYRAMNGLAHCYLMLEENQSAIEKLREAIALAPDYEMAHYNLGIALRNISQVEEADYHFQQAKRLSADAHEKTASGLIGFAANTGYTSNGYRGDGYSVRRSLSTLRISRTVRGTSRPCLPSKIR